MAKRYFWLKLKEDFFNDKRIKKLRKVAGGDTYTIIYLKLALKTLNTNGIYEYESVEENIFEELALELDEEIVDVEMTLGFLMANGLLEQNDNQDVSLPYVIENLGSESASASRVRKHRELKKEEQLALQCNDVVTDSNTEKEKDVEIENNKDKETIYSVAKAYTDDDSLYQTIIEFTKHRTKLKKGMTPRALKGLLNKLDNWYVTTEDKINALDESIINGWLSVYEPKQTNNKVDVFDRL